jgi:hypothetical protein
MSDHRDITAAEAVEWALDPRNDRTLYVMAQTYDRDCQNVDDHIVDPVTGEEVCECWDGITSDDVATWVEDGRVDIDGFSEWGPFRLVWDGPEPVAPRGPTAAEAFDIVTRYLEATMGYEALLDVQRALAALAPPDPVETHPRGHVMGENLCVYCLQYDEDPAEECPERDD